MTDFIHDPQDIEPVVLEEVPDLPGVYYCYGNKYIGLTKDGVAYNLATGNIVKPQKGKREKGRYGISLPSPELYPYKTHSYPRLLAKTFIGRPLDLAHIPYDKLQVNHIDLNPLNNSLDNLEWCTGKENINHSLTNLNSGRQIPMQIKNTINNEITVVTSQVELMRYFNNYYNKDVNEMSTIRNYLDRYPEGIQYKDFLIRYNNSESKWEDITFVLTIRNIVTPLPKAVSIKNLYTGDIKSFNTITDAANYIGVLPHTLRGSIRENYYQNCRYGYWIIKLETDNDWPDVDIRSRCPKQSYDSRSISLLNKETNSFTVYGDIYGLCNNNAYIKAEDVLECFRKKETYIKDNIEVKLLG